MLPRRAVRLRQPPTDPGVNLRKFGLADAIGIVACLVALAWPPGSADLLTYIKLLFLFAGGLAVASAVFLRCRAIGRCLANEWAG